MARRIFTVAEANDVLPEVRRLVRTMIETRAAVLEQQPKLWPVLKKAVFNGGSKSLPQAERQIAVLQRTLRQLTLLGIEVKDMDRGLVDFPAIRQGQPVLLCWLYDEPRIAWWHDEESGFAGRQPLDWT